MTNQPGNKIMGKLFSKKEKVNTNLKSNSTLKPKRPCKTEENSL